MPFVAGVPEGDAPQAEVLEGIGALTGRAASTR
jgi:hypothetical protein